jgi:hypothetical protein
MDSVWPLEWQERCEVAQVSLPNAYRYQLEDPKGARMWKCYTFTEEQFRFCRGRIKAASQEYINDSSTLKIRNPIANSNLVPQGSFWANPLAVCVSSRGREMPNPPHPPKFDLSLIGCHRLLNTHVRRLCPATTPIRRIGRSLAKQGRNPTRMRRETNA